VLRNNSWTSNKHNEKKQKMMNAEHGEKNAQVKPHAYVHTIESMWIEFK